MPPEGSIRLLIKQKFITLSDPSGFYQSSAILCTASPVFAAMLGPSSSFSEAVALRRSQSTQGDPYVQTLFDDDPVALAVILEAIHLQATRVPRRVTIEQLVKLAVVCDKYDCAAAVKLWAETWMEPWSKCLTVGETQLGMLFATWVFGQRNVFSSLTKMLVPQLAFSANGRSVCAMIKAADPRSGWVPAQFDPHIPGIILDAMTKQREKIVHAILAICSATFTKYTTPQLQCRNRTKDPRCDNLILGSLFKAFTEMGLLAFRSGHNSVGLLAFLVDHNTVQGRSLQRLVEELEAIEIDYLDYDEDYRRVAHSETCNPMEGMMRDVAIEMAKIVPSYLVSLGVKGNGKGGCSNLSQWMSWERKLGVLPA